MSIQDNWEGLNARLLHEEQAQNKKQGDGNEPMDVEHPESIVKIPILSNVHKNKVIEDIMNEEKIEVAPSPRAHSVLKNADGGGRFSRRGSVIDGALPIPATSSPAPRRPSIMTLSSSGKGLLPGMASGDDPESDKFKAKRAAHYDEYKLSKFSIICIAFGYCTLHYMKSLFVGMLMKYFSQCRYFCYAFVVF